MAKQKSDLSRAFSEDGALKTHVGGQALIEGIMMRGKYNWSVAVREPDGNIYVEEHDLVSGQKKMGWMHWPLIRGCRALVESLMLGFKALEIAALHAFGDEEEERKQVEEETLLETEWEQEFSDEPQSIYTVSPDEFSAGADAEERKQRPSDLSAQAKRDLAQAEKLAEDSTEFGKTQMTISMVIGLALGVALFIIAPAFLTNWIVGEYDTNPILWNVVDGILRVAVFVFYIWLIGRTPDIKRMFMYHGAEHKTIHCYEHGLELTPENARSFPRLHVRCGTAFLIMVMVIAIIVYTLIPVNALIEAWGVPDGLPKLALLIAIRILFLPVIAGISYEITVKWAGSHPDNPLVKLILWPGMQMQYLTTNEPDESQLECAILAMQKVLEREQQEVPVQREEEESIPVPELIPERVA